MNTIRNEIYDTIWTNDKEFRILTNGQVLQVTNGIATPVTLSLVRDLGLEYDNEYFHETLIQEAQK